jgi:hypothetical protein
VTFRSPCRNRIKRMPTAIARCRCTIVNSRPHCQLHFRIVYGTAAKTLLQTRGLAIAQAVSRRILTAEPRVRSQVNTCGICGGQSGTGTGFSPSPSVFPCRYHSTATPYSLIYHPGHGFSNCGTRTITRTPTIVYWYAALIKKSKYKKF